MRQEISYDIVKAQLKSYLASQKHWENYDLDATGIDIIVSLLAYEESRLATLASMLANESFLPTAKLPRNIIRLAKQMGYVARSSSPAVSVVDIEIEEGGVPLPTTVYIPKGTVFSGVVSGDETYDRLPFVITSTAVAEKDGNVWRASGVELQQGEYIVERFMYDAAKPDQVFRLPQENVVVSSIEVYVGVGGSVYDKYEMASVISNHTSDDKVFYVESHDAGKYAVYFGEGLAGKTPDDNSEIVVSFLVTAGENGNGYDSFSFVSAVNDDALNDAVWHIGTIEASNSGDDAESPEEVAKMAINMWSTQNRAVVTEDYRTILINNFPSMKDVMVWGGDENDPPEWGKVFVCPYFGGTTPDNVETRIKELLEDKFGVVTTKVELVKANEIHLAVDITAHMESKVFVPAEIKLAIIDATMSFAKNEAGKFNTSIYYSDLIDHINGAHHAVGGVDARIHVIKKFGLSVSDMFSAQVYFGNEITPESVKSTTFMFLNKVCFFADTGDGKVFIKSTDGEIMKDDVGIVDYASGKIVIAPVVMGNDGSTSTLSIMAKPVSNNLLAKNGLVFIIDKSNVTVSIDG